MDAVKTNNIIGCLNILAHSTPEDINTLHEQPEGWAPLHVACMFGKTVILQLLIWVNYILLIHCVSRALGSLMYRETTSSFCTFHKSRKASRLCMCKARHLSGPAFRVGVPDLYEALGWFPLGFIEDKLNCHTHFFGQESLNST